MMFCALIDLGLLHLLLYFLNLLWNPQPPKPSALAAVTGLLYPLPQALWLISEPRSGPLPVLFLKNEQKHTGTLLPLRGEGESEKLRLVCSSTSVWGQLSAHHTSHVSQCVSPELSLRSTIVTITCYRNRNVVRNLRRAN